MQNASYISAELIKPDNIVPSNIVHAPVGVLHYKQLWQI